MVAFFLVSTDSRSLGRFDPPYTSPQCIIFDALGAEFVLYLGLLNFLLAGEFEI